MVTGFHRTPEAEKSWSDSVNAQIPYDDTPDDLAYKEFLRKTANCPKEKRKREILSLTRKVVGSAGKEFIVWNERQIAFDGIGSRKSFFRGSMGLIPKAIPMVEVRQIPDTLQAESYVSGVSEIRTNYSVPFNTKNADSFYKDCVGIGSSADEDDYDKLPTQFFIEVANNRFTVQSWEAWRNMPVKDLMPTPSQQQQQQSKK